ncbi:MAG TPA: molybdopterin-synthase adenylyltransferase MoeB [Pseudomonadales bacterium]
MNDQQLLRYSRHILLDGFDVAGQQRLLDSHVLLLGAGGLGCAAALYLAAAGVGHLTIVDNDDIELSNLQRQIAHRHDGIGDNKAGSLAVAIQRLNPDVTVTALASRFAENNGLALVQAADLVLDCSDNFASRFLLNRLCVATATPLVSGAAIGGSGQLAVFDRRDPASPCYRCLFSDDDQGEAPRCADSGVLGPVVGSVGSWQAVEAVKLLAGYGQSLAGFLLAIDFAAAGVRKLRIRQDPQCPVCSGGAGR